MLQWSSALSFLLTHLKNNSLFFAGNLIIVALQLLFFTSQKSPFFSSKNTGLWVFLLLIGIHWIFHIIFYFKNAKRIGLLLLYGAKKFEIFLLSLIENALVYFSFNNQFINYPNHFFLFYSYFCFFNLRLNLCIFIKVFIFRYLSNFKGIGYARNSAFKCV